MSVTNMQELLDRKNGKPCDACGMKHDVQKPCSREALAARIMRLMQANSGIPDLLKQKQEAVEIAQVFQGLLKKADEAHTILMNILSQHGEVGEKIRVQYLMELNAWAAKEIVPTNQDTCDLQQSLFDQEPSTSNVTAISDSTKLESGKSSEQDSSPSTPSATAAEKEQP